MSRGGYHEPAWAFASQVVTAAANFFSSIILLRACGIGEFGRFSLAFMILMIIRNFEIAVVLTPISSILPKLRGQSSLAYRGFLLFTAFVFCAVSGLFIVVGLGPLGNLINSPWLGDIVWPLVLANTFSVMAEFYRRYLFVIGRSFHAFSIDLLRFSSQLALFGYLSHSHLAKLDTLSAIYTLTISSGLATLLGAAIYGRCKWRKLLNGLMWRRHFNFIVWMMPTTVLDSVQSAAPLFIAVAVLGEGTLGLVRATQQLTNVLNLPLNAIQQVLPSMAARQFKAKGFAASRMLIRKCGWGIAGLSVLLGIGLLLVSPLVAVLIKVPWTTNFAMLLGLFMLLNFALSIRLPPMIMVATVEDPSANFFAFLVGLVFSFAASLPLIRMFNELAVPIVLIADAVVVWGVLSLWIVYHGKRYALSRGEISHWGDGDVAR